MVRLSAITRLNLVCNEVARILKKLKNLPRSRQSMSSLLEELKAMRVSYPQSSKARPYPLRKMARRGIVEVVKHRGYLVFSTSSHGYIISFIRWPNAEKSRAPCQTCSTYEYIVGKKH
jgi:hypothetical protein